jgi:uncharacterized LabA/DUF88 family protein
MFWDTIVQTSVRSPSPLPLPRTIVYIDGFNLYYRRLKGTPYRWLNVERMCSLLLPNNQIEHIKYYTARITDPGKYGRQDVYLRALATLPLVSITYGRYLSHNVQRRLSNPPAGGSAMVEVIDNEEKGSDVNLATHLVLDACRGAYEVAMIISNDSDLQEPMRVVKHDLGKRVGLITPVKGKQPMNPQLRQHADFVKRVGDSVLRASQFPATMTDNGGRFHQPAKWKHA